MSARGKGGCVVTGGRGRGDGGGDCDAGGGRRGNRERLTTKVLRQPACSRHVAVPGAGEEGSEKEERNEEKEKKEIQFLTLSFNCAMKKLESMMRPRAGPECNVAWGRW